jgi:MoaA/NifB/PqqE/SkfB family radical SAM enzyme
MCAEQSAGAFDDLDFPVIEDIINDAASYGTREIIISGGGEPFLYPRIWDVLELIEKTGMRFRINTSLNECGIGDMNRIASFKKLASITTSIWAAEGQLYARLHGRRDADFQKVVDNLTAFNSVKGLGPRAVLFCLITSLNYRCIRALRQLAVSSKSDGIEFGLPDTIPGVTDSLLLNKDQLVVLYEDFSRLCREKNTAVRIINGDIFAARVLSRTAPAGEYDSPIADARCVAGWMFLRVKANGDYNSCLKSHRMPIGNAYNESIYSVWNNALQQRFRMESLKIPKDAGYFACIGNADKAGVGCKRVCDNTLINRSLYRFVAGLFRYGIGRHNEKN